MQDGRLKKQDDYDLVSATLAGDGRAFARLVERHSRLVYAAVRSVMGDREEVDDIVQETFIRIYSNLASFAGRSSLSTWIYRIARNRALSAAARPRPQTVPIDEAAAIACGRPGPEADLAAGEAAREIDRLLAGLEESHRAVIELRYLAGKQYSEIAEILDLPLGTVKTLLHRARLRLKDRILSRNECGGMNDGQRRVL